MASDQAQPSIGSISGPSLIAPLMVIAAAAVTLFAPQVMNDADTYWHIAAGQWIIDHRAVPHVDVFSHTMPGRPWQAHEWLAELVMAGAYRLGGWSGVLALFGAVVGLTWALIARRLTKHLSGTLLLSVMVVAFACTTPGLLLRPHILALPLIVAWASEMLAAREEGRAPRLVFALLMILWANLHGSYVFGFALAAPLALEALLEAKTWPERRKVVLQWGVFGLTCLAATAITPHGVAGMVFPIQLMAMQTLDGIGEWKSANFTELGPFEIGLLATLFVLFRYPVKLSIVRLVLLLVLLHMALRHARHLTVLAVVAPLILAAPLGAAVGVMGERMSRRALAIAAAGVLLLCGVRLALPATRTDADVSPITALARTPDAIKATPVLNEYGFGGYLIFKGYKPYIDGRADMYGDDFVGRYFRMARPSEALLDETLAASKIGWTLFPPTHPVTAIMDRKAGWRRLYADDHAVVHARVAP